MKNCDITAEIEKRLFELRDEKYRAFQSKLMPGVDIERIIGVRNPLLRKLAKELVKTEGSEAFLRDLPHGYYDEYNLHGYMISECKDYAKAIEYVDAFLPYVDNWATCDLLSPKAFAKNRDKLPQDIERWLSSDEPFTVRFGIEMLMSHFLDGDFDSKYLERVSYIRSEEYYVNMMIAWYFATALAKQWERTLPFVEDRKLDKWVHNKTIQKANESFRITAEQKEYLKSLKEK